MYCSPEMGQSILNKWKDELAVLSVILVTPTFNFSGAVIVSDCPDGGVAFVLPAVNTDSGEILPFPAELLVSFAEASFEYAEPREAPFDIREGVERLLVCVLTIKSPTLVLTLSEMRNQPKQV
jgi:hypothetical protein